VLDGDRVSTRVHIVARSSVWRSKVIGVSNQPSRSALLFDCDVDTGPIRADLVTALQPSARTGGGAA